MMKFRQTITVDGRVIGSEQPCFVIAEAGVNHNGDIGLALALIDASAEAGADAVKFQTFDPEKLVSASAPKAAYQIETTGAGQSQLDMLRSLALAEDDYRVLKEHCALRNVVFLSTPFEEKSADVLEALNVAAFKLPSGEVTNLPFLRYVAAKSRPVILSTGMSTLEEVRQACEALFTAGCESLAILHCVSDYPAAAADCNLRAMKTLADAFGVPVGFSDHTLGASVSIAAVALGAAIIEKHITLDRNMSGPDHRASLEPKEFGAMVAALRQVQSSLGDGIKRPRPRELDTASVARKSVIALRDLPMGTIIAPDMMGILRPGTGIPPAHFDSLIGRRIKRVVSGGQPLVWADFE